MVCAVAEVESQPGLQVAASTEILLPALRNVIRGLKAQSEGAENCKVFADVFSGISQQPHEV